MKDYTVDELLNEIEKEKKCFAEIMKKLAVLEAETKSHRCCASNDIVVMINAQKQNNAALLKELLEEDPANTEYYTSWFATQTEFLAWLEQEANANPSLNN